MKKIIIFFVLFIAFTKAFSQPPGTITAFAGPIDKIPAGWLICDGKLYDRTEKDPKTHKLKYIALFNAIGVTWGGDAANQFAVPDLRGVFLRGVSDVSAYDPDKNQRTTSRPDLPSQGNQGNNVGSREKDLVGPLVYNFTFQHGSVDFGGCCSILRSVNPFNNDTETRVMVISGGSETRPSNVFVYYIIKY
jgi:hypothetical protein